MRHEKIKISLDDNESSLTRAGRITEIIERKAEKYEFAGFKNLPFDALLEHGEKRLHVELKDFTGNHNSDYISSIQNGHLYDQILMAREAHEPFILAVLGEDADILQAAAKSAKSRGFRGAQAAESIGSMVQTVEAFEANCLGLGVQIWHLKNNPYKRLLDRCRNIFIGGDIRGFAPTPTENERMEVGLAMMAGKGIGPEKAKAVLEFYDVSLIPKHGDVYLNDCAGIGNILAEKLGVVFGIGKSIRPKESRKAKA